MRLMICVFLSEAKNLVHKGFFYISSRSFTPVQDDKNTLFKP